MQKDAIWRRFTPYTTAGYTQKYLRNIYEKSDIKEPLTNSYKNGYPFCYYVEHGKKYFSQAAESPYEIQPVLLFYGAVQLLKACLLTTDVDYPQSVQVLAHGVSTRKKKSKHYDFMQDTVNIQKRGLFTHLSSHLFSMDPLEGQKVEMEKLLVKVPELCDLFLKIKGCITNRPLITEGDSFLISQSILDDLHMTESRFFKFLEEEVEQIPTHSREYLHFSIKKSRPPFSLSYIQRDGDGNLYLPAIKTSYFHLPEILVHFLLLYNLSMISRYETEWWGDLHFQRSSTDLPFIHGFLDITIKKLPLLVADFLQEREEAL